MTADARNYVADGRLICEVDKSNGESSRHLGTVSDGQLFWHRKEPGAIETFMESVDADEEGEFYVINGFGIYGEGDAAQAFLFRGRYQRVADAP